jgi:hypothetical protein
VFIKNNDLGWIMGVAKNRKVSINGWDYTQVQNLEIPNEPCCGSQTHIFSIITRLFVIFVALLTPNKLLQ